MTTPPRYELRVTTSTDSDGYYCARIFCNDAEIGVTFGTVRAELIKKAKDAVEDHQNPPGVEVIPL